MTLRMASDRRRPEVRREVKVTRLTQSKVTLADARQKSDSKGLVGGPLLCGFSFAERVLR